MSDEESESEYEEEVDEVEELYLATKEISNSKMDQKIKGLQDIIPLELKQKKKKGEFSFKALKRLTKIFFDKNDWASVKKYVEQMTTYVEKSVPKIMSDKKFDRVLEYISKGFNPNLKGILEHALPVFKEAKHEKLYLKTKQKYANYLLNTGDLNGAEKNCLELMKSFGDNTTFQNDSIVVSAILVQVYYNQKNFNKLRDVYNNISPQLEKTVGGPRYIGIISEYGGKLHLNSRDFYQARSDFSRAFKSYEGANLTDQCISSLRYMILTSMLSNATINPMAASDMSVHRAQPDIEVLSQLIEAFISRDVATFENILNDKTKSQLVYKDPLIKEWMGEVIRVVKIEKLRKVIVPFTAVSLAYLAQQLRVDEAYVLSLLPLLIADGQVLGKVDQVKKILYLEEKAGNPTENLKYNAWMKWAAELNERTSTIINSRRFR